MVKAIDYYRWLSLCINGLGISHKDFWDMPFFMVTELVANISSNSNKNIGRKEVLDGMRFRKQKLGWV